MPGADGCDGASAHVGDDGGIEDGAWRAGARVEEVQDAELGRQAVQVVVDIVADDLHAGSIERRHIAAQHIEMAVEGRVGLEMDARLDHSLAVALRGQPGFDGADDLGVAHLKRLDVESIEVVDIDGLHAFPSAGPRSSITGRGPARKFVG